MPLGGRARKAPVRLSEQQQKEREEKREAKKRKRAAAEATAADAFDMSACVDIRETAMSIARTFVSRCCKADVKPIAPKVNVGFRNVMLPFQCTKCKMLYDVVTAL